MKNAKTRTSKRCPTCHRAWPNENGYVPRPMLLEAKFQRGLTTLTRALKEIHDQRGVTAAKSALKKLQDALKF
ncbi:MAG TPA: hypothetical protein VFV58_12650 [Blastocatellia bacterium]|jgi:hypothetical protein|nr:hypothetical protein [Blastocatellia bacterium]